MHSPSGLGGEGGLKVLEKSLLGGGGEGSEMFIWVGRIT